LRRIGLDNAIIPGRHGLKKIVGPEKISSTPVHPERIIIAAVTPPDAGFPPKRKAFSNVLGIAAPGPIPDVC